MIYNKIVHDYFFSPQHIGVIDVNHPLAVFLKNNQKGQGTIELYLQCGSDRIIKRVSFKTNGNPYLIAGLEWLCRQIDGRSIDSLASLDYKRLIKELDLPIAHYPLALRIFNILKDVLILMNSKLLHQQQHGD